MRTGIFVQGFDEKVTRPKPSRFKDGFEPGWRSADAAPSAAETAAPAVEPHYEGTVESFDADLAWRAFDRSSRHSVGSTLQWAAGDESSVDSARSP